jgi:hypothetical protein
MSWSEPLSFRIQLRDGREMETLRDAAQLVAGLSETVQAHEWLRHAVELLIKAAESELAGDIEDATWHLERALRREGML